MSDRGTPNAAGLLRTIDISSIPRLFFWIKWGNVFILSIALQAPFVLLAKLLKGEVDVSLLAFFLPYSVVLGFAAWIAWKTVTVLNAVIQPWTLTSLFLLAAWALGVALLLIILVAGSTQNLNELEMKSNFFGIFQYGSMGLLAMAAAISVLWLRRRRIEALDLALTDFMRAIQSPPSITDRRSLPPKNGVRGWWLIAGGSAVLLGIQFVPDSLYYGSSNGARTVSQIGSLAFFLFLYARSQFQPTCETLLAHDKRAPVLLLRSFRDDEVINYRRGEFSFVDHSLESRITAHFFSTGPFIAVGAPKNQQPTIGAARATLVDSEWQGKVMDWMDAAALIIVIAGLTSPNYSST
jgi:hypothetical protein